MKATVNLVYETKDDRQVTVEIRDGLRGERMMKAIDKAVEKSYKDDDWTRWNLIEIQADVI